MTPIVISGKSPEWQDWRGVSVAQGERVQGQLLYKDLWGDKTPDYSAFIGSHSKGTAVDWHHGGDEILYILTGRVKVEDYDVGKTYIIKPGDLYLIKGGSKVKQTYEEDCDSLSICIPKYDPSQDLPL